MKLRVRFESGSIDRLDGYVSIGCGLYIFDDVLNVETHTNHVVLYLKNDTRKVIYYKEFDRIVIEKEEDE